jgi:hypothetical protein
LSFERVTEQMKAVAYVESPPNVHRKVQFTLPLKGSTRKQIIQCQVAPFLRQNGATKEC